MRRLSVYCAFIIALISLPLVAAEAPSPRATTAARHEVLADDGHRLTLWGKQASSPKGAILLLHGRTWSALPNFDLQVEGSPRSVLEALAQAGYAAYALDQRGYGATPRDASGWLDSERAVRDTLAAVAAIRSRHPGSKPPVLIGYSRGALTALLTAQRRPDAISVLVLYGFGADVDAPLQATASPARPPRAATTANAAAEDFVSKGAAPQAVIDAYVKQALAADPVRVDWRDNDPPLPYQPERVTTPTLLLHGIDDGYVKVPVLSRLFARLGTQDRSWVVLPRSDHAAHVEDSQAAWLRAILDFIERPRSGS
jgi:alpha-beta hydrolase superfamily lysophospholipase